MISKPPIGTAQAARETLRAACAFVALALATALQPAAAVCDDLTGMPINFNVDWQTQIKPIINDLQGGVCTSCHNSGGAAGGLDLSDDFVDAIYKIVNNAVDPGFPASSRLFDKVNCDPPAQGSRMPLNGSPLTLDRQALIYDWINQGALGEDPKEPISRDFLFRDGDESLRQ